MVAVHHHGGVGVLVGGVALGQALQVLVVVVGVGAPIQADVAAEHGVRERVAVTVDLPVAENEGLRSLSSIDRIEHHGGGAGGRVLHAHGRNDAARNQTVLLVLHRAGAHGHVREQVDQVLVVAGVEHLVCGEQAGLLNHAQVHVADSLNAGKQVVGRLGVGVVQQTLVASTLGARLVGVHARNDDELVLDLVGELGQTHGVLDYRVLAVCRAGADDEQAALVLAGKDLGDLGVKGALVLYLLGRERHVLTDLHGDGEASFKVHGHMKKLLYAGIESNVSALSTLAR